LVQTLFVEINRLVWQKKEANQNGSKPYDNPVPEPHLAPFHLLLNYLAQLASLTAQRRADAPKLDGLG
jgi:hypothetical protein